MLTDFNDNTSILNDMQTKKQDDFYTLNGLKHDICYENVKYLQNKAINQYLTDGMSKFNCDEADDKLLGDKQLKNKLYYHDRLNNSNVCNIEEDNNMRLNRNKLTHGKEKQVLDTRLFKNNPKIPGVSYHVDEEDSLRLGLDSRLNSCKISNNPIDYLHFTPLLDCMVTDSVEPSIEFKVGKPTRFAID